MAGDFLYLFFFTPLSFSFLLYNIGITTTISDLRSGLFLSGAIWEAAQLSGVTAERKNHGIMGGDVCVYLPGIIQGQA